VPQRPGRWGGDRYFDGAQVRNVAPPAQAATRIAQVDGWLRVRCGWGWLGEKSPKMALTRLFAKAHFHGVTALVGRW
jgi:hypothetical protein